jgi:hypothetical protein
MKKLIGLFLFFLWKLQFKKEHIVFPTVGYHCRECIGGKELDCGDFPCPCKPNEKLVSRFVNVKYNQLLNKGNNKLL